MTVTILQINLHHCKEAAAALLLHLSTGATDIVLIQEPYVVGGKVCGIGTTDFKLLHVKSEGSQRTCILARKNLNIFLLPNFSGKDQTAASLEIGNRSYLLVSSYLPYDDAVAPTVLFQNEH